MNGKHVIMRFPQLAGTDTRTIKAAGLDDKPAAAFTLAQLRDTLLREGETHDFKILRAGHQTSIHTTVVVVSIDQRPS
jgi:hypothetical protein